MERSILHLDLDAFFVSVERMLDRSLNDKAILVGGTGGRGVVSAASYEARKYGAHSGMPMKMARLLCPDAIVIRGNASTYIKYSDVVTEIIQERVPVLEKASVDEFYADLSGMDRYFGCYKYASELRQTIMRETGLPISFGLSQNKVVSKVATGEAKPNNQRMIEQGKERTFLSPLSVRKIPMVGEKTHHKLANLGVKQIKTIQEMPQKVMYKIFGKAGNDIWNKAHGIDNSPVIQYHERKSISSERTFGRDTTDVYQLRTTIKAMAEQLCFQLRNGNKVSSCISVKIRYSDFQTYSKQAKIPYSAADHILIPKVLELFEELYQRRMLVRLVGVRMSGLATGSYQLSLFEDTRQTINLYKAMDAIRIQYGSRSVFRASTLGARSIGGISNPFDGKPPIVLAHRSQ